MPVSIRLILLGDMPMRFMVEKTRGDPANVDKAGPVTVVVRIPNVLIIDSRGRHILVAPEQAELVSAKMGEVADWIRNAAAG